MRVRRVVRETAHAVTLELEDPTGAPVRFAPGQFFTLELRIDGEAVKRAYSASSSALDSATLQVTVKRVEGGRVSSYLVDRVREGDAVGLLGPSGSFIPAPSASPRRLVLVGGGSGITPLLSIARTVLASEPATRIALVYGNRSAADVIFNDVLHALASEHAGSFVVRHVLEHPPAGWSGGTGLLDGAALARELEALRDSDAPTTEYFLCGPAPMMSAARERLESLGVAGDRIHEERFVSAHASQAAADLTDQPVTARLAGRDHTFVVPAGSTVLEAALGARLALPFSCSVGGCGTCLVRLAEGRVEMDEPNCLSEKERAEGLVLACVARPASPCTVLVLESR